MRYPCPCCGHLIFEDAPGSYDFCKICFWADDDAQLRWPDMDGGANTISLIDSQRNFASFGAVERGAVEFVRPPSEEEPVEAGWRPIDERDNFEPIGVAELDWPSDLTVLYYWRPTFWRVQQTDPN